MQIILEMFLELFFVIHQLCACILLFHINVSVVHLRVFIDRKKKLLQLK